MTSKSSFFNLLKEDFRRRLWTFILASLVFFGTFVIGFTMVLQGWVSNEVSMYVTNEEFVSRVSANVCDFLRFYPWYMVVAIVGAVICGISGFAYLHSKKQMDFYHSLPVTREKIFAVRFVNGILIFAVPYLIGLLYAFIISAVLGVMTLRVLGIGLFCFVLHLMGYIIMYLVTIIAMMLTGKIVMAFFGTVVLAAYVPAVYGLCLLLKEIFFITSYSSTSVAIGDAFAITKYLSPISYYYSLIDRMDETPGLFWKEGIGFVLFAGVLMAVALVLYRKRPSEKAGTAMSFRISEPIVRILITIPVGIITGILLFAFQYGNSGRGAGALLWLFFGILLGTVLSHGIIESLYHGDVKKCLSHKIQMVVAVVVAAVVPACFYFDVFGYDSYVPAKEKVENMAMYCNDLRFGGSYYNKENGNWCSNKYYVLNYMEVTEFDALYELAETLSSEVNKNRLHSFLGYGYVYTTYYAEELDTMESTFTIRYTLKNGKEVIRTYEYNYYAVLDLLERIYNNEEYKKAVHPIFTLMEAPGLELLYCEGTSPVSPIRVQIDDVQTVLETYMKEMLAIDFEELKNTAAIGEIEVVYNVGSNIKETGNATTILVYPSMTETIALLKKYGCTMQGVEASKWVESIRVYYDGSYYNYYGNFYGDMEFEQVNDEFPEIYVKNSSTSSSFGDGWYVETTQSVYEYEEIEVEITDKEEIAECLENLIYSNYRNEFGPFPKYESNIIVDVFFKVDQGLGEEGLVGWNSTYRFKKGTVPQFLLDRIEEELLKAQDER